MDAECSGFDDMFPTIDPYTPQRGKYQGISYPDHGEVCRLETEWEIQENSVHFQVQSRLFPIVFQKTVTTDSDDAISVHYQLQNHGDEEFPYIWAAHCMLKGDDHAEVITPFSPQAPIRMMFGPEVHALSRHSLSGYRQDGNTYKFYYTDKIPKGYCGYRYHARQEELLLQYDAQKIPYLGVWFNNGSFKEMYNIALEPCTAPFDTPDAAKAAGAQSVLPPKGCEQFTLRFLLKKIVT